MSGEENKALIRRLYEEVVNRRNYAAAEAILADDYAWRNATGEPAEGYGREWHREVTDAWLVAFPDLSASIVEMIAEGDLVVARIVWRGTHLGPFPFGPHGPIASTGRRFELGNVLISRVADGRIAEEWEAFDIADLWRQLGVIPDADAAIV
jgi:steroid delta-isomerase-like uncharacterized protein